MSLFYAYLKDDKHDHIARFLITFVNRETADEWWRFISTPPSPHIGKIERISPQFYIHHDHPKVVLFFFNNALSKKYLGKMFFTLLNDKDARDLSIAPPIKITDHISGKWYYVRSMVDPKKFWYARLGRRCRVCGEDCDVVHTSTEYRTRFHVGVYNPRFQVPKDLIMIGADKVSITASKDYVLRISGPEKLKVAEANETITPQERFLFQDFKDRFVASTEENKNGDIYEYVVPAERGLGEAWELVA